MEHTYERCPQCAYALRGHSVAWSRQVIELPEPEPAAIIEHRGLKGTVTLTHCEEQNSRS